MTRMLVFLVGVLACIGSVVSAEPPQGPWETLNPAAHPETQPQPHKEELVLTPEEEFLVKNIPFKLPFKMDKKQTVVAMKLMKEAVKPIIKSKTLQDTVSYVDDLLVYVVEDMETQMYMRLFLDFMQDIYEGKEREQVDKVVRSFIHQNSDEATARTIDDVWAYMSDPMTNYIFNPMRSYVVRPISNAVSTFAERIGSWMGSTARRPYTSGPYVESSYDSWSNRVNSYARALSSWTRQARQGLSLAAHIIEAQDQARACPGGDCGPPYSTGESSSVQ